MKFNSVLVSAAFAASVFARPSPKISPCPPSNPPPIGQTGCNAGDVLTAGQFNVAQNFLGADKATSGSQCTTLVSDNSNTISWATEWSWAGAPDVIKSFANAGFTQSARPKQISCIKTIPTEWQWSYNNTQILADVAYNIFTSSTANGKSEFQVSIWLASFGGLNPPSTTGSPIEFPLIDGTSYELFQGTSGDTTIFTYTGDATNEDFNSDLNGFLTHLVQGGHLSNNQFVNSVEAGTEAFTGSNALFNVQAYSLDIQ